ncbi:TIGR01777 family oxidoreductase [Desulfobacterales bacterium HSG16]|nr:TIGR01777 family oxidoreductase [Desulfobacterales bacterium HSG16]
MKIMITGGSGFVGTYLSEFLLDKEHTVIAVSTSPISRLTGHKNFKYFPADTTQEGSWQNELEDINAVINLAGRNIFKFWTKRYKAQINDSRILTTRNLVNALPEKPEKSENKEIIFLSTSAAGYYGDRADEMLYENTTPGDDFLAKVCLDWEKEALLAEKKGARVALMRFGVVLGKNGGALAKMIPAFKLFVGGPIGTGKHWFPWIHINDLLSAITFILENNDIKGPVNLGAPDPVRNHDLAKALGSVLKRPSFMPAPAFMIKFFMGELGKTLLNSQRMIPDKLVKNGFEFEFPEICNALRDLQKI